MVTLKDKKIRLCSKAEKSVWKKVSTTSSTYFQQADDDYWLHGICTQSPNQESKPNAAHGLISSLTWTMINLSKLLSVTNEQSHQVYLPRWSELTNFFLLKWKYFSQFQKTKYHLSNFLLNGCRQTTVMIKICALEDCIKKMKTCTYLYPMPKKNSKKNLYSDAPMKRLTIELCSIWAKLLKFANLKVIPLPLLIQIFLLAHYIIMEILCTLG